MKDKLYSENTKANHYTYVYYNDGSGYSREKSSLHMICDAAGKMKISLDEDRLKGCKELRIDPVECACVIKINRLEAETDACFRKILLEDITMNGKALSQGIVVFAGEAPQIILNIPGNEKWIGFTFEFELLSADIAALQPVFMAYEQANVQLAKEYEEKYQKVLANSQAVSTPGVSEQEQLLRDKLAYIQSTTVYRKLLKSKIDAMGLWSGLEI